MSELEDRWFWAYPTESVDCDGITGSANEVYSKSDVDKVIAEKGKQLRHHKHKRCLAMARWFKIMSILAADYRVPRGEYCDENKTEKQKEQKQAPNP